VCDSDEGLQEFILLSFTNYVGYLDDYAKCVKECTEKWSSVRSSGHRFGLTYLMEQASGKIPLELVKRFCHSKLFKADDIGKLLADPTKFVEEQGRERGRKSATASAASLTSTTASLSTVGIASSCQCVKTREDEDRVYDFIGRTTAFIVNGGDFYMVKTRDSSGKLVFGRKDGGSSFKKVII